MQYLETKEVHEIVQRCTPFELRNLDIILDRIVQKKMNEEYKEWLNLPENAQLKKDQEEPAYWFRKIA